MAERKSLRKSLVEVGRGAKQLPGLIGTELLSLSGTLSALVAGQVARGERAIANAKAVHDHSYDATMKVVTATQNELVAGRGLADRLSAEEATDLAIAGLEIILQQASNSTTDDERQAWLGAFLQTMSGVGPLGRLWFSKTVDVHQSTYRSKRIEEFLSQGEVLDRIYDLELPIIDTMLARRTYEGLKPESEQGMKLNASLLLNISYLVGLGKGTDPDKNAIPKGMLDGIVNGGPLTLPNLVMAMACLEGGNEVGLSVGISTLLVWAAENGRTDVVNEVGRRVTKSGRYEHTLVFDGLVPNVAGVVEARFNNSRRAVGRRQVVAPTPTISSGQPREGLDVVKSIRCGGSPFIAFAVESLPKIASNALRHGLGERKGILSQVTPGVIAHVKQAVDRYMPDSLTGDVLLAKLLELASKQGVVKKEIKSLYRSLFLPNGDSITDAQLDRAVLVWALSSQQVAETLSGELVGFCRKYCDDNRLLDSVGRNLGMISSLRMPDQTIDEVERRTSKRLVGLVQGLLTQPLDRAYNHAIDNRKGRPLLQSVQTAFGLDGSLYGTNGAVTNALRQMRTVMPSGDSGVARKVVKKILEMHGVRLQALLCKLSPYVTDSDMAQSYVGGLVVRPSRAVDFNGVLASLKGRDEIRVQVNEARAQVTALKDSLDIELRQQVETAVLATGNIAELVTALTGILDITTPLVDSAQEIGNDNFERAMNLIGEVGRIIGYDGLLQAVKDGRLRDTGVLTMINNGLTTTGFQVDDKGGIAGIIQSIAGLIKPASGKAVAEAGRAIDANTQLQSLYVSLAKLVNSVARSTAEGLGVLTGQITETTTRQASGSVNVRTKALGDSLSELHRLEELYWRQTQVEIEMRADYCRRVAESQKQALEATRTLANQLDEARCYWDGVATMVNDGSFASMMTTLVNEASTALGGVDLELAKQIGKLTRQVLTLSTNRGVSPETKIRKKKT